LQRFPISPPCPCELFGILMSHCDSHDTQTDPSGRPLGKLAIITYRCKPAADGFTLDALALRSAVLAAQQNSVKYLWLDAWTYRKQPPWATYEHDDFVRTLVAVMLRVSHVIWLPRSREHDPGEYQTRIWCTFEATIVHLRRLPVTAAGHSLSLRQLDTAAFGKYLVAPALLGGCCCPGAHDVDMLGWLNLAVVLMLTTYLQNFCLQSFNFIIGIRSTEGVNWMYTELGYAVTHCVLILVWLHATRTPSSCLTWMSSHLIVFTLGCLHTRMPAHSDAFTLGRLHTRTPPQSDACTLGCLHSRMSAHSDACTLLPPPLLASRRARLVSQDPSRWVRPQCSQKMAVWCSR